MRAERVRRPVQAELRGDVYVLKIVPTSQLHLMEISAVLWRRLVVRRRIGIQVHRFFVSGQEHKPWSVRRLVFLRYFGR